MAIEIYRKKTKSFLIYISILTLLTISIFIVSLSIGSSMLDPREVFKYFFLSSLFKVDERIAIISMLRLSRTIASIFCGATLALAGIIMQTVTRNPLADPYILGLSSTALTAVSLSIIISPSLMVYRQNIILVAFIGAILGYLATLSIAKLAGGGGLALILAGIAISSLFSGLSHILLYIVQNIVKTPYVYLLMGSTQTVLLKDLNFMIYPVIVLAIASTAMFKPLNAYLYGDEYLKQLGFNPKTITIAASTIAALATAITIAFIGIVGFIGLAAPHIARFLVGSDHRFSIPTTVFIGAILTTLSDIAVRAISISATGIGELPLGVVTAVIGAPFLAYLIVKKVRE